MDELVVLEENEKAVKIKSLEQGVHWIEWDRLDVRVLHVVPFKKKTLRDSFKLWLIKHI